MELQRTLDNLLKWMHRYVSPVFLALLVASFILWYIAKLSYTYTTEQVVLRIPLSELKYKRSREEGHEGKVVIDPQSLQSAISVRYSDIKVVSIGAVPELDYPEEKP